MSLEHEGKDVLFSKGDAGVKCGDRRSKDEALFFWTGQSFLCEGDYLFCEGNLGPLEGYPLLLEPMSIAESILPSLYPW